MKICMRFNIKYLFLLVLFAGFSLQSFSQEDNQQNDFWKNVRFGGGIGLSFGDGFFSGTLAPSAIYDFNDQFSLGLGLNGTYNSLKNSYNSTIFGASIISLFNPLPEIQLSGEFELLNVNRKFDNNLFKDENYWYPALFLGAGYRMNNIAVGIRYDVLYDRDKSIYADPWAPFFRVYF
ncbi:alpha-ketoglutarate decarboxylase [Psychroserpens sp. AS72]|uniref:alpha-ketoglutarate decarboxylase n=1 Tax=Psychroserpens sp. AS72 TaxID=3135775 RepID=UPI003178D704